MLPPLRETLKYFLFIVIAAFSFFSTASANNSKFIYKTPDNIPDRTMLVLAGGGVRGVAYAGAFQGYTDQGGKLESINTLIGASSGSIFSMLIALGYSSQQISAIALNLDYTKIIDQEGLGDTIFGDIGKISHNSFIQSLSNNGKLASHALNLFTYNGLYTGKSLHDLLKIFVQNAPLFQELEQQNKDMMTLADIQKHGGPRTLFVTTNAQDGTSVILDSANPKTNSIAIADAVRTSSSFPIFFFPIYYTQDTNGTLATQYSDIISQINDKKTDINLSQTPYPNYIKSLKGKAIVLLDGGLSENLPLELMFNIAKENNLPQDSVLGLVLAINNDYSNILTKPLSVENQMPFNNNFFGYVFRLLFAADAAQFLQQRYNPEILENTLLINTEGVPTLGFSLSKDAVKELYDSGYKAVTGKDFNSSELLIPWQNTQNPFNNTPMLEQLRPYTTDAS